MDVAEIMSAKEILNDFKENYTKVRKLIEEDSKNDPENEPYLSKYKAKEILCSMNESLLKVTAEENLFEGNRLEAMLGAVLLNIGIIDMETEELTSSAKVLSEAANILAPYALKPEVVIILINVYNHLGILWTNREHSEQAKSYLLQAKEAYENFKCTLLMPLPLEHILSNNGEQTADFMQLEKAYTLTLYYLAQVCQVIITYCISLSALINTIPQCRYYLIRWLLLGPSVDWYRMIEKDKHDQTEAVQIKNSNPLVIQKPYLIII